jgi:RNA polymerase sigma-70 factor (ECF subfamily)
MLMGQVARGDVAAFEQVYRKYFDAVRSFLSGRERRRVHADIDDMAQEVFVRLWKGRHRFRGEASARTYMLGIAQNVLREEMRRSGRAARVATAVAALNGHARPAERQLDWGREELVAAAEAAKGCVTPLQWQAFELACVREVGCEEAARTAGCSVTVFRNRLTRARQQLGRLLREFYPG